MTIKEIKSIFLKKGWAGKTLGRRETATRLNLLIEECMKLKHAYTNFSDHIAPGAEFQELEGIQKILRLDVGKLKEHIFSCGEIAFNGTSLEPEEFELASEDPLSDLRRREDAFHELLDAELPIEHQIRTEAVLTRLRENAKSRLVFLRKCGRSSLVMA